MNKVIPASGDLTRITESELLKAFVEILMEDEYPHSNPILHEINEEFVRRDK